MSLIFLNNVAESYIDQGKLDAAYNECQRMIEKLDPTLLGRHINKRWVWVHVKALANTMKLLSAAQKSH
jgi:hypothetical protein